MNARPPNSRQVRAFSIPELLIAIGLLTVLLSMTMPLLHRAKSAGVETVCLSRLREFGHDVTLYSVDYQDAFPATVSDRPGSLSTRNQQLTYARQSQLQFTTRWWREIVDRPRKSPQWHCPDHQFQEPTEPITRDSTILGDYALSESMYMDPTYLDPSLPKSQWRSRFGARHNRVSDLIFPSSKVTAFEAKVWHAFEGNADIDATYLFHFSSKGSASMWFSDGHAIQRPSREAVAGLNREPIWASVQLDTTPWGIRGIDFP